MLIPNQYQSQFQQVRNAIEYGSPEELTFQTQNLIYQLGGTKSVLDMPPAIVNLYILSLMFGY